MSALLAFLGSEAFGRIIGYFISALGQTVSDDLARRRSEETQEKLGRAEADLESEREARRAAEDMSDALANAPQGVDDAIRRLREGSA